MNWKRAISLGWATFVVIFGLWFLLLPFFITTYYLVTDEGLREPGGSKFAFAYHKKLSKRYQRYAEKRVESGIAKEVHVYDISATEWPLFGSVFYLLATQQLQESWEVNPSLSKTAPKEYARDAIDAAKNLVLDEGHAHWVKHHWGETDYLTTENVFYRMLVMWAIVSHHQLTGSEDDLDLLRSQVESFSAEFDASTYGLLNDYPHECYPTDVVAALSAIRAADQVLKTDHGAFLDRSIRGFQGPLAEPYGLPPYAANAQKGQRYDDSRGCGNSYFCSFGPMVWPDEAEGWYQAYVDNFWQENWFASGFREFPEGAGKGEWYFDVDAGPVLGGFGSAASAFGVAAARTNGDFERGFSLASEMVAYSGPMANGTLFLPRLVSNQKHAPFLGEVAILFQLSREPIVATQLTSASRGNIPGCVWILLGVQLLLGGLAVVRGCRRILLAFRR